MITPEKDGSEAGGGHISGLQSENMQNFRPQEGKVRR